jgi:hypothetical protein
MAMTKTFTATFLDGKQYARGSKSRVYAFAWRVSRDGEEYVGWASDLRCAQQAMSSWWTRYPDTKREIVPVDESEAIDFATVFVVAFNE